jgi:hypothetical protein
MVTLEQVKLLETKVIRAVEYVERLSRENSQLEGKVDSYQKRINDLEVLIQKFKEDQGRIEEGILSSLERLNKFEDAIEKIAAPPQRSGAREAARQAPPVPPAPRPEPPAPEVQTAEDGEEAEDSEVTEPAAPGAAPDQTKPETPEDLFPGESAGTAPPSGEIPGGTGLGAEESPPKDGADSIDSAELDIF